MDKTKKRITNSGGKNGKKACVYGGFESRMKKVEKSTFFLL